MLQGEEREVSFSDGGEGRGEVGAGCGVDERGEGEWAHLLEGYWK